MSDKTECKELAKNRAYQLKIGDVEFSALKLEGFKAIQMAGTMTPVSIGAQGAKTEGDDWLIVVKNKDNKVMPYGVWAKLVAEQIHNVSGSNVQHLSVAVSSDAVITSPKVGFLPKPDKKNKQ